MIPLPTHVQKSKPSVQGKATGDDSLTTSLDSGGANGVVRAPSGTPAALDDVSGLTPTPPDNADKWFIGFSKNLAKTNKGLNPFTVPNRPEPASSAHEGLLKPSSKIIGQP